MVGEGQLSQPATPTLGSGSNLWRWLTGGQVLMEGLTYTEHLTSWQLQYSGPPVLPVTWTQRDKEPHPGAGCQTPQQQAHLSASTAAIGAVSDLHTGGFQVPLKHLAHFTDGLSLLLLPTDVHQLEGGAASALCCPAP